MPDDLPDDPREWPADSFAVLGVPPGAADAAIKKAYVRLIRRFKPEHHPDAFRRVREAYEDCLRRAGWYRNYDEEDEVRPPAADPEPTVVSDAPRLPVEVVLRPEDALWADAVAGREDDAYAGLVRMAEADPTRADLCLRLYWLAALRPDAAKLRYDWLAASLARGGLGGPAAELYRRELEADPVTLGHPFDALFTLPGTADDVLAVARWRLAAAGRAEMFVTLTEDLAAVRGRLRGDNEAEYLGLLVAAKDWLGGAFSPDVEAFLDREIAAFSHLEMSHAYAFDRADEATHVGGVLRRTRMYMPWQVAKLVRVFRAGGWGSWAAEAEAAAAAVAADPDRMLTKFDRCRLDNYGAAVELAARAFAAHYAETTDDSEEYPPARIRALVALVPPTARRADYDDRRPRLLALLVREAISPYEWAAACRDDHDPRVQAFGEDVATDVSLRAVWLACRIAGVGE